MTFGAHTGAARKCTFLLDLHTKKSPLATCFKTCTFFHEDFVDLMVVGM